jgi:hypothetical protein
MVPYRAQGDPPGSGRSVAQSIREIVVDLVYWLILIAVLAALWYAGLLRPTGLAGRTRAEEGEDRRQDAAANWLKRDGERNDKAP